MRKSGNKDILNFKNMKATDFENKLLETDAAFREAYYKDDPHLDMSHLVVRERVRRGLTQKQLASLTGTKQSDISRIESGTIFPGWDKLARIGIALGKRLNVTFDDRATHLVENSNQQSLRGVKDPYLSEIWRSTDTSSRRGTGNEKQVIKIKNNS